MKDRETLQLVGDKEVLSIYIDPKGKDYDGLSLVASSLANDIYRITDRTPSIITENTRLEGNILLIAGSIGNNDVIDMLIAERKIDTSPIKDKWECYQIQVIDQPLPNVEKAIIVMGSDKRGTIYGLYRISELIGVSPLVYWGDVEPMKQQVLVLSKEELTITSKEPSVKYRGIFLNDEWPSLGSWCSNSFGGFNEELYQKVFELLLRLKANYIWPAMWSAIFSEDGKESKIANAKLANAYGIVMGTSHHEGMFRAGAEWQQIYSKYGESNEWDFGKNRDAITRFWEDAVLRNKDYENLITLGMRGECDSALGGGIKENIDLLKDIILTQKELLRKYHLENAPKVLTLYKEVEQFWYGTDEVAGLKDWEELNDVIIMLSEDNFGNVRTLPDEKERERKEGYGMYYHFDYHGGPVSYEWVNTTPLEKTWEQMSMAYDYGVQSVWIVNVGDLKPMEFPISYFLDLAYDFETWGTDGVNKTKEYTRQWVEKQFPGEVNRELHHEIITIIEGYTKLNGICKPEILTPTTYSKSFDKEAKRMLDMAISIENKAKACYCKIQVQSKDTYYQLVYYPAVASANVVKMQIYAGFNQYYYSNQSLIANGYGKLVEEAIETDIQMQNEYNTTLSNGKWRGMMSSPHVGYKNWNADGWSYPQVNYVTPKSGAIMLIDMEGEERIHTSGTASLPTFTNTGNEMYEINISNGGDLAFNFTAKVSTDWIVITKNTGEIVEGDTIGVSIDWNQLSESSEGNIIISDGENSVTIDIRAVIIPLIDIPEGTFVGYKEIAIEGEHFCHNVERNNTQWKVIDNYGRALSALKMYPTTHSFTKIEEAPYLEYLFYIDIEGEYVLKVDTAPSNNIRKGGSLKFAIAFDGDNPSIISSLPDDFIAGDYNNRLWCEGVMRNIHTSTSTHSLSKGIHQLRFYGLDAGLVLQRLVISEEDSYRSYLGPKESYRKGVN
jgi:hypothetical protein